MGEQLKPCPFCGGEAILRTMNADGSRYIYSVHCENGVDDNCGARIGGYFVKENAIRAWNTRANGSHSFTPCYDGPWTR